MEHFDVVFVPGLFYAFNDAESLVALRNIKLLTKKNGRIIILHRARDSILTFSIDYLCKYENKLLFFIYLFFKKNKYIHINHHGYRRSIKEFSRLISSSRMKIINILFADHYTELNRLIVISKLKLFYLFGAIFNNQITYLNFFIIKRQ